MDAGDLAVRASIWLAVLCFPAGPAAPLARRHALRAVWTIGCVAFLVHTLAAFHVHYGWSHQVALRETARQAAELVGRDVPWGLYLNYAFALLWTGDAAWWWLDPASHRRRPLAVHAALHVFLLFILFNGAAVFVSGPVRWLGVAATAIASIALVAAVRRPRRNEAGSETRETKR